MPSRCFRVQLAESDQRVREARCRLEPVVTRDAERLHAQLLNGVLDVVRNRGRATQDDGKVSTNARRQSGRRLRRQAVGASQHNRVRTLEGLWSRTQCVGEVLPGDQEDNLGVVRQARGRVAGALNVGGDFLARLVAVVTVDAIDGHARQALKGLDLGFDLARHGSRAAEDVNDAGGLRDKVVSDLGGEFVRPGQQNRTVDGARESGPGQGVGERLARGNDYLVASELGGRRSKACDDVGRFDGRLKTVVTSNADDVRVSDSPSGAC